MAWCASASLGLLSVGSDSKQCSSMAFGELGLGRNGAVPAGLAACRDVGFRVSLLFGGGGGAIVVAAQTLNRLLGLGRMVRGVCRVVLGAVVT